jgi:hypothetical protein
MTHDQVASIWPPIARMDKTTLGDASRVYSCSLSFIVEWNVQYMLLEHYIFAFSNKKEYHGAQTYRFSTVIIMLGSVSMNNLL